MKNYIVEIKVEGYESFDIHAGSEEEAIELALEEIANYREVELEYEVLECYENR